MNISRNESLIKVGIWSGIVVASILVVFGVVEWRHGHWAFFETRNPQAAKDWGDYGSYLQGTVASLWSLAGFFIILVAFLAQKQQLLQQQKQFERHSFENQFFELLTLHNEVTSEVSDVESGMTAPRTIRGHECFKKWYQEFHSGHWGVTTKTDDKGNITHAPKSPSEKYLAFYGSHQELGHYFRNLYHLIKFVKSSGIEDKRRYTSLARAQLSQYQLALLFYNGLTAIPPETENKFKPLIEEFGLLENRNRKLLLNPDDEKLYDPSAFK